MAFQLLFKNREELLRALADTYGRHPPMPPPFWWPAFEAWYARLRNNPALRSHDDPEATDIVVHTDSTPYEDDE